MGIDLGRFRSNKEKSEWVDWLADDPVPPSVRQEMRAKLVREASRPVVRRLGEQNSSQNAVQPTEAKAETVSINISIPKPKLKKPQFSIPPQLVRYKKYVIGGVAVVVIMAGIGGAFLVIRPDQKDTPSVLAENNQRADFDYSLPKGDTGQIEGEVRYDAEKKLVNYRDSIGGVPITISQQQLPDDFKEDTDEKIKEMAANFSATHAITTATPTAYLGTSEKGPQTVIFAKKNLLVFIQSTKNIDEHDWAEYVTNLQ